ncbi:MAG: transcriptional regulator [Gammaproteobacteria bacterium]|nr:MAG: transcriptional regulator [Gammaproteobacteria bacterium]
MKFSDKLIQQAEPHWQRATDHIFVQEMVDGTLKKQAFSYYLIQDYAFVNAFLELVGYTIAYSDTIEQKHRLSTFLSMVTSEENDYFIRSFEALGVPESEYRDPKKCSPAIQGFQRAIQSAIFGDEKFSYANCLIVLACAESVYCEWGVKYRDKQPEAFYFNEWLTLHNNDFFQSFVAWLKSELDRLEDFPAEEQQRFSDRFNLICELEAQFFDECYAKAHC